MGSELQMHMRSGTGALVAADCLLVTINEVIVEAVLERSRSFEAENAGPIRFVFAEKPFNRPLRRRRHNHCFERGIASDDAGAFLGTGLQRQRRFARLARPRPSVARPELRQDMKCGWLICAVFDGNAHHDIVGRVLRILDNDIEIAVVVEHAGIEDFIFRLISAAPPVFLDQLLVGVRVMRILVQHLHVRMSRRAVEIEVQLLYVLAVIALLIRQSKEPLLDDRIMPVPERERHAPVERVVAESGDPVFTPTVHAAARVIVREVVPRRAVFAVVLTDGTPLTLAQIGPPAAPSVELWTVKAGSFLRLEQIDCALRPHGTSRPEIDCPAWSMAEIALVARRSRARRQYLLRAAQQWGLDEHPDNHYRRRSSDLTHPETTAAPASTSTS